MLKVALSLRFERIAELATEALQLSHDVRANDVESASAHFSTEREGDFARADTHRAERVLLVRLIRPNC